MPNKGNISTIEGLFLVTSNLALLPAIIYSLKRKLYPEAALFISLALVSTAYHYCQSGVVCVFSFKALQTTDHFFVYSAMIWLVLYFVDLKLVPKYMIFILLQMGLLPSIIDYINEGWILSAVVISVIVIIGGFIIIAILRGFPKCDILDLFTAVLLIGGGFFFHVYAGSPGDKNYAWSHAIWHIMSMLAIFFILEVKDGISFWEKLRRF